MDESPLAGLCSCPRVTATCAQSPTKWLRMTSVGSSPEEKIQAGYVCSVADKSRMEPLVFAPVRRICEAVTKTHSGLWFGTT
jgi:hypothetical protein